MDTTSSSCRVGRILKWNNGEPVACGCGGRWVNGTSSCWVGVNFEVSDALLLCDGIIISAADDDALWFLKRCFSKEVELLDREFR